MPIHHRGTEAQMNLIFGLLCASVSLWWIWSADEDER